MKEQLYSYIDELFKDKFNHFYTMQPATIISFNDSENELEMSLDNIDLILKNIPITIFGDKNSYVTTPTLHSGTKGLLIFSKHDLYSWLEDGRDYEAKTDFSKNNGFFLIGASWHNNRIANYNLNAVEIKTNKAFECFISKHILLQSGETITSQSTGDTIFTSSQKLSATSSDNMDFQTSKTLTATATQRIDFNAPKISLKNTASGEELISLVIDAINVVENIAYQLTLSKDTADESLLTNSGEFANLQSQIAGIKSKVQGFQ